MLESGDTAQNGVGDAGIQGHDTEWDRRCWSLGTRHRVGPEEILLSGDTTHSTGIQYGSVRTLQGHAGVMQGSHPQKARAAPRPRYNSLPKHSPGNREWVARDLGSTRRASTLGEQGEGSRSRQTRDNITPVLGHYGTARTVLVAGSTSTGSWDLPTLSRLLWTKQPGKLRAGGGGRLVRDSWQQLQQHIPMGGGRGRCPLARPCQVLHHRHKGLSPSVP